MAFTVCFVKCEKCGHKERRPVGAGLTFNEVIECPGKKGKKSCGAPLVVGLIGARLPIMFRQGEKRVLRLSPAALAHPFDREYPIKAYHGKEVIVATDGPDDEGLVDVIRPFPDGGTFPVLHGVLKTS